TAEMHWDSALRRRKDAMNRGPGQTAITAVISGRSRVAFPFKQSVHMTVVHSQRKDLNMAQAVVAAIEELQRLNVSALRRKYQDVFGEESRSSDKEFLFRVIALGLQGN